MSPSATSVPAAAASRSVDPGAIVVPAAAAAAPSEFAAVLRCYIPECEESERTGRFNKLNMALRGGPPYRDADGARSWWAW